jgi:anti-sigma factor RsiW
MNNQKLEQLLLLEQSGELSPKQRRQLDAELAASAEARQLRNALRGLAAAIPAPSAQPAPDAAARIDARLRPSSKPSFAFLPAWKPAFAAAAALALLFGVRTYHAHNSPVAPESAVAAIAVEEEEEWTDPLDAEFTELESLIDTLSSEDSMEFTDI